MKTTALPSMAAGLLLAACVHAGVTPESASADIDPYAPAAPQQEVPDQTSPTDGTAPSGSDKPVAVDPMMPQEETPTLTTRDYVESKAGNGKKSTRGTGSTRMMVNVLRINIRSSPDRKSRIVGELRKGEILMVDIDESIGWAKITDGEFIRARHLKSAHD